MGYFGREALVGWLTLAAAEAAASGGRTTVARPGLFSTKTHGEAMSARVKALTSKEYACILN